MRLVRRSPRTARTSRPNSCCDHLGHIKRDGSAEAGLASVHGPCWTRRAAAPNGYDDLFDGLGMSVYNRVKAHGQLSRCWPMLPRKAGAKTGKTTFPSAARRLAPAPLPGHYFSKAHIFAKTGTPKGTNNLSGYMVAASAGR